ncbi:MAG TPA: bifunctional diaminohydroxyphosphoribosylaminopyrimidine deaminase/5-amino-6-(5-phosphoribosylamino)uracil reductase RibD [Myxococcota bacterium]|nr:bifunctional diaminohydroxyphosphoribosylaminopyrimidine deaminase/5-amino-6-(5-phosphoribosylamino)uracil reductase RibD [Myxococcota bacterium]
MPELEAESMMRLALREARRASGRTHPNPPVGAVVYRGATVLGRGFTRPAGGPHAEVVALRAAAHRHGAAALRGASLAVTLEPCCHVGRTGPCTRAIIDAGIAHVVAGHRDPNPRVGGRGLDALRAAGVGVESGALEAECRAQHRGFVSVMERGRPFVALKLAASLDGRIATARGESRWITGDAARAAVHALRARSDAIVVGSRTAMADDPELAARRGARVLRRPIRVLVDSALRASPELRLFRDGHAALTWVLCAEDAPVARRRRLERAGARLLPVPRRGPEKGAPLDLRRALRRLAGEGLTELLVEGGGGLAAALLQDGLVDELHWFAAPVLIGGDGVPALGALGVSRLAAAPRLADARLRRLPGGDLHLVARVAAALPSGRPRPALRSRARRREP